MSIKFNAWVMRGDIQSPSLDLEELSVEDLPDQGEVLVRVRYSSLNYKDGMILSCKQHRGLVRDLPHVPGIDFVGEVVSSDDGRYEAGDRVILTGWTVGEQYWGGYSGYVRVKADFLVKLPENLSEKQSMAVGTAGLTAMLCIEALEANGLTPSKGPVLVTGAAGGVGTVAIVLLSALGYEVVASSGREHLHHQLEELGASRVIHRKDLSDGVARPLDHQHWAGCVDSVGGDTLSKVITQTKANCSIAACGLAGGVNINTSVMPFLLRGIGLLGINSVDRPYAVRVAAWDRIASMITNNEQFEKITSVCSMTDLPEYGANILKGAVFGRVVVEVSE